MKRVILLDKTCEADLVRAAIKDYCIGRITAAATVDAHLPRCGCGQRLELVGGAGVCPVCDVASEAQA